MAKLIVAIVNWNTRDLTRACLNSLMTEIDGLDHDVWCVDNDSADDSTAMIREEFPNVVLIENDENTGFARANNQILRKAKGDYFLLLNTDTVVPSGSIRALCKFLDDHPDAAAAGPRLHNGQGNVEPPLKVLPTLAGELRFCMVSHSGPFASLARYLFRHRQVDWRTITGPQPAEVLSAACLIIRREVFDDIGYLPEDYFLFSEENDFFTRMRRAGYQGYYLPDVEMVHLLGMSRKKRGSLDSEMNFFRSRLLFFRRFYPGRLWVFKLIYLLFFAWSAVWSRLYRVLRPGKESEAVELYNELWKTLRTS